jgi:hypothetical protein
MIRPLCCIAASAQLMGRAADGKASDPLKCTMTDT